MANAIRNLLWGKKYYINGFHSKFIFRLTILVAASQARVLERQLVQQTATQLNYANSKGQFTEPALWLGWSQKQWGWLTSEMSGAQLQDFEESKTILERYDKLYSLLEYTTHMNENMIVLERKIMTNNSTIPMNFYRACSANSQANLFP